MSEIRQKVFEWFEKNSRPGKTKFYIKNIIKGLAGYDKIDVRMALKRLIDEGELSYYSIGSTIMFCLAKHYEWYKE